nr:hypothetical protein CFP56_77979 [Quercus suber]
MPTLRMHFGEKRSTSFWNLCHTLDKWIRSDESTLDFIDGLRRLYRRSNSRKPAVDKAVPSSMQDLGLWVRNTTPLRSLQRRKWQGLSRRDRGFLTATKASISYHKLVAYRAVIGNDGFS